MTTAITGGEEDLAEKLSPIPEGISQSAQDQQSPEFSSREKEVLNLLIQGQANKEIAVALSICAKTVEFHLTNIYAKLSVTNRAQAVAKALQLGIGKN